MRASNVDPDRPFDMITTLRDEEDDEETEEEAHTPF